MNTTSLDDFQDIPSAQRFERYVTCVCPFHSSYPVRNSLFIYSDFWICKSCNKKGSDHNYLLQALNSGSSLYFEPKKFINPWNQWIRDYGSVQAACVRGYQSLKKFPQQKYYLNKRGIDNLSIQELKLGYLNGYYTIPFLGRGGDLQGAVARKGEGFQDQGNKYVTPSKKYQDNHRLLYIPGGWEQLDKAQSVFLCFGILSAISVFLNGKTAISTVSGTTLDPAALEHIRKTIYILPDLGEEAPAMKLANQLGWRGKIVELPYTDILKDPNDLDQHNLLRSCLNAIE